MAELITSQTLAFDRHYYGLASPHSPTRPDVAVPTPQVKLRQWVTYGPKDYRFHDKDFSGAIFPEHTFTAYYGSDLHLANLRWADLSNSWFPLRYNLSHAKLCGAKLAGSHMVQVYLHQADLRWADLSGVDLSGADCSFADFRGADLTNTVLTGALLDLAKF